MEEFWKPIPTFETRYEVSTEGRVRNAKNGRVLKSKTGSVSFVLADKKIQVYQIRHLLAWTFLGADINSPVKPKLEYIDGNPKNIQLANLRLADSSSNKDEEWKDVEGYAGQYQISNQGRVKRLARVEECFREDTQKTYYRRYADKILNPVISSDYYEVNLVYKDRSEYRRIHRMVAEAFIPNLDKLPCVNHIDGNKKNNRVENLEWCTYKENVSHASLTGLRKNPEKGVYRGPVKVECIQTGQVFNNMKEAAESLNLSYYYLSECINTGKPCHGLTFNKIERS